MIRLGEMVYKAIKFGLVGLSGLLLDFSVTWLLKEKVKVNKYIANSCGFCIAAINNYTWNRFWTFNSRHLWPPELFRFILFAVIGLLLNNLLLFLFHKKLSVQFYLAKGMSIICVFVWNFFTNFFFNFN